MKTKRFGFNMISENARKPAFTVVEILIVLLVVALVGGVAVSAFFVTYRSYRQSDDHVTAAEEVEYAMGALRPQFTNIGLGMPNNLSGKGSFNISFTGPDNNQPVMAYMGDISRGANRDWGGPVTIGLRDARSDVTNAANFVRTRNANGVFAGQELFYAWAVPTGIRLRRGAEWDPPDITEFSSENPMDITFRFLDDHDVERLEDFTYDFGRRIGVSSVNRGENIASWILFPSFRIPLLISAVNRISNTISARVSPYASNNSTYSAYSAQFVGTLYGYEEVHLLQAACIFSDGSRLIQRIYGNGLNAFTDRILATNVLGVYFVFDDERRILTMYTVARGNTRGEVIPSYNRTYLRSKLPEYADVGNIVAEENLDYRMLVESMTWRIRN